MSHIQSQEDQYIIPLYKRRDIALSHGKGVYVYDEEGKEYLDFCGQYGPVTLGHAHPAIQRALQEQAGKLTASHTSFYSGIRAAFAKELIDLCPKPLTKSFFFNSGAECVDVALKFARVSTGRSQFISTKGSYHGRTFGGLTATGQSKYTQMFEPLLPGFTHVPFNDLKAMEEAMSEEVAAVILEPIQAESGIRMPDEDYLKGVRKLCDQYGILLILDEIQVGYFRTGSFLAADQYDVIADIVTLSKAIGNGFPLAAIITTNEVASKLPAGTHGTTFGGNPLACAAGLATLNTMKEENIAENISTIGSYLMEELKKLQEKNPRIREIRGRGLIIGIELKEKVGKYLKAMQEKGILVIGAGPVVIRLLPPYVINKEQCDVFLRELENTLS